MSGNQTKNRSAALMLSSALLMSSAAPAAAQSELSLDAPQASGLCLNYQISLGPEVDILLANDNPEEHLQATYQASRRLNLITAACAEAPETNPYADATGTELESLRTELATNTTDKCNAIGSDVFEQLKSAGRFVTSDPDQLKVVTTALRQMNGLLIEECPDALQGSLTQLGSEIDRYDAGTVQWPICLESRTALTEAMDTFAQQLEDPANDPATLQNEAFRPAVAAFEADCAFDQGWRQDKVATIAHIETLMSERTPSVRNTCLAVLPEIEQRIDAINARSAAFEPGCSKVFELEYTNVNDKRSIETVFNNTCRLFPAAIETPRQHFQRAMRLVDELYAEHSVMRYRIESGETDVASCRAPGQ